MRSTDAFIELRAWDLALDASAFRTLDRTRHPMLSMKRILVTGRQPREYAIVPSYLQLFFLITA